MAYNPSNVTPYLSGFTIDDGLQHLYPNQYIWKYTTTDNIATVLGHDPITGSPYMHGETRFRFGDWISVEASDGLFLAHVEANAADPNPTLIVRFPLP